MVAPFYCSLLLDDLSGTSDESSSSSCDKTTFLTSRNVSSNGSWMTYMLMITTTMGMFNWVHCNTSDSWPMISLCLHLVPGVGSLKKRLIGSLSSSANSNHGSAATNDGLSGSWWKSNSGLLTIIRVTNDDRWSTWGSSEWSSVSDLTFNIADDGTFWHLVHWDDISDGKRCFDSGIDELAGVHSFDSDEVLNSLLVSVCISEGNLCKWCSSAWIMNDILHNTLQVSLFLTIVESSESRWSNSVSAARCKNKTTSVSLCSNASTHD